MNIKETYEDYQKEYLEKVERILKIPSVYEESPEFPYGKPIDDVLNKMLEIAEEDGFVTKNVDGHAGHIEFGEGDGLIGILGHLDVVPAGQGWSTPPFQPTLQNGKLYARGAQDDKGPVMAAYIAMKLLKDQGFTPNKRVRLILGTDEERDWKGIEYYFQKEEMPTAGFTPDASFPVIHAEKGLLDSYMTFPLKGSDEVSEVGLKSIEGGDRLNMVPDEATAILTSNQSLDSHFNQYMEDHGLKGSIEKNASAYTIIVKGVSVHASKPELGVNAITALIGYLSTLPLQEDHLTLLKNLYRGFSETDGKGIQLEQMDEVSGPLTLNLGSIHFNAGEHCKIGTNLRYPVTSDYEFIIAKMKRFAEEDGEFRVYDHLKSLYMEKNHPFIKTLLKVYNEATGEQRDAESIGGATYARSLEAGVAFGALFKDSPDTAHQKDEHVRLADMMKSIEIFAASIYELTK